MRTIVEIIKNRAKEQPLQPAVIFVNGSIDQLDQLNNAQFDKAVRDLSSALQRNVKKGERVLLLMNPSQEYILTFFACLYSGIVAVPAYPMKTQRKNDRIQALLKNAKPSMIITHAQFKDSIQSYILGSEHAQIAVMSDADLAHVPGQATYVDHVPALDDVAFIQYSSGSTSTPKGVVLTHRNIAANELMIQACFKHSAKSCMVSWLPPFHDMGMIGGIMQPLYVGFPTVLIPPTLFLQKPIVWLQAISMFRGTTGGAPNFAYELCTQKVSEKELSELDLSSWAVAFNGAEPIKGKTLAKFAAKFSACGFSDSAFLPCYGLAEATLLVSGRHGSPKVANVDGEALEKHRFKLSQSDNARGIVSCGAAVDGLTVKVVDPQTKAVLGDGEVGEIWIKGDSIAKGYFANEQATAEVFQASTAAGDAGYLRTGDLGALYERELYVTGRMKDMIIIRGRNIYPHDIEAIVSELADVRAGGVAAVGLNDEGDELLAIAAEVSPKISKERMQALCGEIMQAAFENFEVRVGAVALLATGRMPKTSSGKVQRHQVMKGFMTQSLEAIHAWRLPKNMEQAATLATPFTSTEASAAPSQSAHSLEALKTWLNDYCSRRLNMRLADERRTVPPNVVLDFASKGLFGLEVPVADGGLGLPMSQIIELMAHLAGIDTTLASLVGIHNALGLRPVLRHASESVRKSTLRKLAEGRGLAGFAVTEPQAGSNPRAMTTTARDEGDFVILNGEKKYTGLASWAHSVNVFAKHYDAAGKFLGISAFLVQTDDAGFKIGDEEVTMGIRSVTRNKLYFENCRIPKERLLGAPGQGFSIAEEAMSFGRLSIGASSLGGMQRCVQMVLTYASQRDISSGRMLENDFIRHRLTEAMHKITVMEQYLKSLGQLIDAGTDVPEELFIVAKVAGSEFLWETLDVAMQSLGGRGYTENNRLPQYFRDGRLFRIFEGPTETLLAYMGSKSLQDASKLEEFVAKAYHVTLNLSARLQSFPSSASKTERKILEQRVGALAQWLVLQAVTKPEGALAVWFDEQIRAVEESCRRSNEDKAATMSAQALSGVLQKFSAQFGGFQQEGPREDQSLDAFFTAGVGAVTSVVRPLKPVPVPADEPMVTASVPEKKVESTGSKHPAPAPAEVRLAATAPVSLKQQMIPETKPSSSPGLIEREMLAWLSKMSGLAVQDISLAAPISSLGIDSIVALDAIAFLEGISKTRLPADLFWSVPNLRDVIKYVEGQMHASDEAA